MKLMNTNRNLQQKTARRLRLSLCLMALTGMLLSLPAVDAYTAKLSKGAQNAQDESDSRVYSVVSPRAALPIQNTKTSIDLPTERYQIDVDSQEIDFTLDVLASVGKTEPNQVGIGRSVGIRSDNHGKLIPNQDGSRIRVLTIKSPDAIGMRVHIERFNIAPGDEVYIYGKSSDSYVSGPYTLSGPFGDEHEAAGGGAFWTETIEGDTVIIEHYMKGEERGFDIPEISHFYTDIPGNDVAPNVLACHNDANCFSDVEKNAVGRITFISGTDTFVCTGTMMNNRVNDHSPYFYTANHCVSTQTVAQTVETYWFYRTTACNSGVVSGSWLRTPSGASVLATQQSADSTLLRIFKPVPGNLGYAGWDPNAKSIGTNVFGLSHPGSGLPPSATSYLRRASGSISAINAACAPSGLVNGYSVDWSSGLVEPGASGSGIFSSVNGNNFLVGVLSCVPTPSTCADFAIYGKFSAFYPAIQTYMDLGDNTGVCAASAITPGQTVSGSLVATDCRSRVRGLNFFSDRFSFSAAAGQQVAISLSSGTVDTYLYLLSPGKTVIAEDNNGGGGTNSRIPAGSGLFTIPSTGTYVIEISSFAPGASGSYILTLSGSTTCNGTASPTAATISSSAGSGSFTVTTSPAAGCGWTASSNAGWLTTNSSGNGSGSVTYAFSANPGSGSRSGIITVQGSGWSTTHTVTQNASGGGFDTAGLYNPATSTFFLRNSNTPGVADVTFSYGQAAGGWVPIAGDWNGDGVDTIGLYGPAIATFFLRNSNTPGVADVTFSYGPAGSGWLPIAGDWNGDGIDTIGLYNPATSTFFLRNSNTPGVADVTFSYGQPGGGWLPIAGDWNGNGVDTIGLYGPAISTFFLRNSNTPGVADVTFSYGQAGGGWLPIAGDWNGDGIDTIGLYGPAVATFFLRNSNTPGVADVTFSYGPAGAGWKPIVGNWNGLP